MTSEVKFVYGTPKTLEANGASIATAAIGQADDADWSSSDTLDFPDAIFVLTAAFGGTPTAGKEIELIIRPMNIDGTSDGITPTAAYRNMYFGSFFPLSSGSQLMWLPAQNIPKEGQAWLYNNATGQTMSTGWTLKMTPRSVAPS